MSVSVPETVVIECLKPESRLICETTMSIVNKLCELIIFQSSIHLHFTMLKSRWFNRLRNKVIQEFMVEIPLKI